MPEPDGSLGPTDIAILSARAGVMRCGASRANFCPEDVEGVGKTEPGEYVWKEYFPPTTQWTLLTEGRICGYRPVAAFTSGCALAGTVAFTDASTPTGGITYWAWDFGDGGTSNDQNPSHTYAAPGLYTVTLSISSQYGSDTVTGTVSYMEVTASVDDDTPAQNQEITLTPAVVGGIVPLTYLWDFGETTPRIPTIDLWAYWDLAETSGLRNLTLGSAGLATFGEIDGSVPAGGVRPNHSDEGTIASEFTNPDTTPELYAVPTPSAALASGVTIGCWFKMRSDNLPAAAQMNMFSIMGDTTFPATSNYILAAYRYCVLPTDVNYIGLGHTKDGVGDTGILPAVVGAFSMDEWHFMCAWWDASDNSIWMQIDGGTEHTAAGFDFSAFSVEEVRFGGGFGTRGAWHGELAKPMIWLRVLTAVERGNIAQDGFSSEASPNHAYIAGGEKTVTLTVTDANGCTATDSVLVTVAGGGGGV